MEKKLAKITNASLEIQERGILNFWIHVDYEEGCSQGVGGIALDDFDKIKDTRVGTAFGCELIRRILLELHVDDFSEMKNKIIWVYGDGEGFSFTPRGISSLYVNNMNSKPVIFSEVLSEFKENTSCK